MSIAEIQAELDIPKRAALKKLPLQGEDKPLAALEKAYRRKNRTDAIEQAED